MTRKWFIGILMILLVTVQLGCAGRRGRRTRPPRGPDSESVDITGQELVTRIVGEDTYYDEGELRDVHFEFDKFDLLPAEKEILKESARWLKAHRKAKVLIEGHCDERGTQQYNLALGERRALSVRSYLISLGGIDSERLITISYGEEQPANPGQDEAAWYENRRAHLMVSR